MKVNRRPRQLSRRRFIGKMAADAAALTVAASLRPLSVLAQAVGWPATASTDAGRTWTPSDSPNQPVGTAKGIFPGRVVWVRDPAVARWNGKTGRPPFR